MGRIFVGLCQVGAWGCFDEFNRLEERMLSAVSQQIQTIQLSLREGSNDTCKAITENITAVIWYYLKSMGLKLYFIHFQQQPLPLSWLASKWEWAVTWQSSLQWIQAMLEDPTSQTTWRSCSVAWPWLLLTGSSLHRSCCTHRASELQRNWQPRLFHSSSM